MKFGYFDDKNREYVITSPKTPYPWINYLGTQGFFSLISNTAGGYCFYKDARLRRITRYRYNNVPIDMGGRYFYINDGGHVWNPGWSPVKTTLDSYECRHGMGYTIIKGSSNGVTATATFFVPQNFNGEIQKVTIKNDSDKEKNLKLFSFLEWCLWDANDDTTNFQRNFNTGEVEIDGSVIYHKTEYKERRDHYAFYSVNAPINGYDTDRESFLGLYNGFDAPQTVFAGAPNMSVADGWSPVASHYIEIKLQPGESKDLVFCLGYVENKVEEKFAPDLDENSTIITSGDRKKNIVNKAKAQAMIAIQPKRLTSSSQSLRLTGTACSVSTALILPMKSSTEWLTSGTSISAWLHSICHVPHLTLRAVSAEVWASVTPTRTYSASYTRSPQEQEKDLSTLPLQCLRTAVLTTSISPLQRWVTTSLALTSTMTRCG